MSLGDYYKKRNFHKTPEPTGKISLKGQHRFIIQKHAASHLHYDFRIELNGVLKSWAIPKGPSLDPSIKRLAIQVEDHPVEYGSFEGVIPQGQYGGGTVMLWDRGKWQSLNADPAEAYETGHISLELQAEKLKGRWELIRFKKNGKDSWFLIKANDKFAKSLADYDITLKQPNSVLTGQSLEEIANNNEYIWSKNGLKKSKLVLNLPKTPFPISVSPQLATLVSQPPEGTKWLHEIKWDGYRILALKKSKVVRLISRTANDWTIHFPNIVDEIKKLGKEDVIFDGEIILLDDNRRSDFQLLQNSIKSKQIVPFTYFIFDLLYYDKHDLRRLSLLERKSILEQLLPSDGTCLHYSSHIFGDGATVFEKACEQGFEGIISKQSEGNYLGKRTKTWLKVKCVKRQEFVIGGYSNPEGVRNYFGALYLGVYNDKGELIYCGNVGTGFTEESLKTLYDELQKNRKKKCPFTSKISGASKVNWIKPKLVAEVEFTQWTHEGKLRHPSFKGLRADKKAIEVIKEKAVSLNNLKNEKSSKSQKKPLIRLTNSTKILYSEDKITKRDLYNYYDLISDFILPHVINRPLTLVRCPESYKKCFYQKHLNHASSKELQTILVEGKKGNEEYLYLSNKKGLLSLVQLGVLEIHPWGSTIAAVDHPDRIIFDLDPAPELEWKRVVEAAFDIREKLKQLQLKSFVKTTGGKGLHIIVPIQPKYSWNDVKNFSYVFVEFMEKNNPGKYITNMVKAKREGKIFMDYLRNQRGATAVSAYSSRARPHAPVSVPIHWDELTNVREDSIYTIRTLPQRLVNLAEDPWEGFWNLKQHLKLDEV